MNIKELQYFIQSANINFLYGAGVSRPYLSTLGNVEKWLTQLAERRKENNENVLDIVEASIYKVYSEKVILPNYKHEYNDKFLSTQKAYSNFLLIWNEIINKRRSRILNKQINLFTTNIDTLIETTTQNTGIEINDGFRGSYNPVFDEGNFQKSVSKTSAHFGNMSEIPIFNLIKMHGSINWIEDFGKLHCNYTWSLFNLKEELEKIDVSNFVDVFKKNPENNIQEKSFEEIYQDAQKIPVKDTTIYNKFKDRYRKIVMINPNKQKFETSVMDYHFYELMRIYSNTLEKENTILFVMGFSFADEHIANITRRAANSNPTLQVVVFAYSDNEETSFKKKLAIEEGCENSNIMILTAQKLKESNAENEKYKKICESIECFDLNSINKLFDFVNKEIHFAYE